MTFQVKQFDIGPMQNFGYMIADQASKTALMIDPAWEPDTILKLVEQNGWTLAGLAITHAHYDHTNAILELMKRVDVPVYANKNEVPYSKMANGIVRGLGDSVKPLEGNDTVQLGETTVTFLHTPGHTPGSQCIRVGDYLITGDTLFVGGCGRSDLPGGDATTLFKSLRKIASLPPQLTICPGHDYGEVKQRTLKDEIQANPYLQMTEDTDFLNAVS